MEMKPTAKKRVAAYIRVSGAGQVSDDAFGPDIQRNAINAFAVSQDWEIVETYEDLAVTGRVLERPALQRMIQDAEAGEFSVVLVHRIDRMSRSLKDLLKLVEDILEPVDIALKSVTESFVDTSSPEGKAMFQMLGSFAELDKNQLIRKLKSGRLEKHQRGGYSVGATATGYESVAGKLVVVDEWAEIVQRIFRMALRGDGISCIARILNEEGVTTKNAKHFYPRTVKLILTNRTYTGVAKNKGEVKGIQRPIIAASVFGKVQRILEANAA
jgi:site-specific DNA recombinase